MCQSTMSQGHCKSPLLPQTGKARGHFHKMSINDRTVYREYDVEEPTEPTEGYGHASDNNQQSIIELHEERADRQEKGIKRINVRPSRHHLSLRCVEGIHSVTNHLREIGH